MPGRLVLPDGAEIAPLRGGRPAPPDDIAPGDVIGVLTAAGPVAMRWGLIPVGRINARKRPVMETIVNARSETVFDKTAFAGVRRAIVEAAGWYEWTGPVRRKTRWRIAATDGAVLRIAAITDLWTAPGGVAVPQVALVTCAPNSDVRDYHHRMPLLLSPDGASAWMGADETAARQAVHGPAPGRLRVDPA